jgi:signal transduction histidine kinase
MSLPFSSTESVRANAPDVPLPRLVNFIRQVTHDVRNGLNAIDLQAAYIAEIADGEAARELGALRAMITHVTKDMQELSSRFGELRPVFMRFPVDEFLTGFKEAVETEFTTQAKRIVWDAKASSGEMEMDYTLMTAALIELIRNAINFREGDQPIRFSGWNEDKKVIFEVRQTRKEPVPDIEDWGRAPLSSSKRGGYGLGLFYVRRILVTLGGTLDPAYDGKSGEIRVRLIFPFDGPGAP